MFREVTVSHPRRIRQQGFSLVELVIAMTVTLIISGAVFQLVTAGQTAFRKEPALADRQQNIRVAIDVISQDLYRAGYGLPQFAQAFTDSLDAVGSLGPLGEDTDELEIFAATECPTLTVCDAGTGSSMTTFEPLSDCYVFPALVILGDETTWGLRWAEKPGTGSSGSCPSGSHGSGSRNGHVVFPHGQAPLVNPPGGFSGWEPEWMLVGQAIHYRVRTDADGVPSLERSAYGGQNLPGPGGGTSSWEIVARGVEDLQVEYLNGAGWQDEPGTISCGTNCDAPTQAEYDTLIRRVRVRLSARAEAPNLQGQSTSAVGNAVRGQLVTEVAPRATVVTLGQHNGDY
jgi:prepilin-type N-terminal cleavage/methylation domain-containing protein